MSATSPNELIRRRFLEAHGANVTPGYNHLLNVSQGDAARAALGYRRARDEALFLERYLDMPVEQCVSAALGRTVGRDSVIEVGNLAASDPFAMISLWGRAANDLGTECEIAVATLTAPLRAMFRRMGLSLHVLASAQVELADQPSDWGRYYDADPMVCAGLVAEGQRKIAAFLARRPRVAA